MGGDARPHLVPIVFAVAGDAVYSAVDAKPKRTTALKRLENIARNPRVALLADHYDDADWSALWWVRADGAARVLADGAEAERAVALLRERYEQYRAEPPRGPGARRRGRPLVRLAPLTQRGEGAWTSSTTSKTPVSPTAASSGAILLSRFSSPPSTQACRASPRCPPPRPRRKRA